MPRSYIYLKVTIATGILVQEPHKQRELFENTAWGVLYAHTGKGGIWKCGGGGVPQPWGKKRSIGGVGLVVHYTGYLGLALDSV